MLAFTEIKSVDLLTVFMANINYSSCKILLVDKVFLEKNSLEIYVDLMVFWSNST